MSIKPWQERLVGLDRPTDFAERCAAIAEAGELRIEVKRLRAALAAKLVPMTEPDVCKLAAEAGVFCTIPQAVALVRAIEAHHSRQAAPSPEPTDAEPFAALQSVDPQAKRLPPGFRDFARAVLALKGGAA